MKDTMCTFMSDTVADLIARWHDSSSRSDQRCKCPPLVADGDGNVPIYYTEHEIHLLETKLSEYYDKHPKDLS